MTVSEFLAVAASLPDKASLAVVHESDKFSGTYKPSETPTSNIIELFDVTHYHGIYIDNYAQFSIPLDTVKSIYIE